GRDAHATRQLPPCKPAYLGENAVIGFPEERSMTSSRAILALAACLLAAACDRNPSGAPPLPTSATPEPIKNSTDEKSRPTTQELLTGQRRTIRLGVIPLTVLVPERWEVKTYGTDNVITFLEGPAPHDDVKIQLARRPPA